ncbi:MAG: hypothetical protein WCD59_07375, partial [Pseudolabrys sp.]
GLAGDQHEERLESHLRFRVTFQLPRRNNELARRLVVTLSSFCFANVRFGSLADITFMCG